MYNQMAPFGVYGLGQMGGWPQYPIATPFLQGYQQDPYGLLARQAWAQMQATNPWVVQALLGELVGAIARQGHHHMGLGHAGFGGPMPYGGIGPTQPLWNTPFGQGSYGIGPVVANGVPGPGFGVPGPGFGVPGPGFGPGLPFPAAAGAWSPTMAMV